MGQAGDQEPLDRRMVARALDQTRVLDPVAKRRWRVLLPHLGEAELRELWAILTDAESELSKLDDGGKPGDAR